MAFTKQAGARFAPRGCKVKQSPQEADKAKSIAMALMRRQGKTFREIADFFNMRHSSIQYRIERVPAEDLRLYA